MNIKGFDNEKLDVFKNVVHLTDAYKDDVISYETYSKILVDYYAKQNKNNKSLIGEILIHLDLICIFGKLEIIYNDETI